MNLKDFLTNRDNPPELFWSIVLEEGWIQAGIWFIGETAAEVVSVSPGAAWSTEEELVGATDAALSGAIQKLPENYIEPSKTVFGVAASWVEGGVIKEEYLNKIKKLCAELSLNPVGFVVMSEAIAHLHKSEEGSPLSAILLGLGPESLELSVFKLGNLVGTTQVSRSISLVEDVVEGLSRFGGAEPLPSRIIVYDGKEGELEEAKEALLQASWEESQKDGHISVKFLHTPKVEVLGIDRKVFATSLAGAAEIGHVSQVDTKDVTNAEDDGYGEKSETNDESSKVSSPDVPTPTPEDFGFAVGKDVSAGRGEIENVVPPASSAPAVLKSAFNPAKNAGEFFRKMKNVFRSLVGMHPKNSNWIGVVGVALILIAAAIFYWWFYPKAKVTVFVTPKRFEQQTSMTFGDTIPVQVITDQVTGTKTKSTTGVKLIGNKAGGNVQIANGNSAAINLVAGTILTSASGLKFVTSSEASVSGQILPGSPGTASVNVAANDIGAQYNLAKGEVFSVGNYSKALVAATSTADFAGGSSQEISAVSRDDQTKLETDLKSELSQNAKNDILAKITGSQIFITDLAGLDVTNENFDHKIGDQADSVKLTLTLNATGLAADKTNLLEYAKGVLKDKVPDGFTLKDDQIDFKFTFLNQQGGKYNYTVIVGANFLPEVDAVKIINQISGKTQSVVQTYLNSIPGFGHAEIKLSPKLPGPFGTLPRVQSNITLDVSAE